MCLFISHSQTQSLTYPYKCYTLKVSLGSVCGLFPNIQHVLWKYYIQCMTIVFYVYSHILYLGSIAHTVCPRSSDPFHTVSYYINWSLLLGHIVSWLFDIQLLPPMCQCILCPACTLKIRTDYTQKVDCLDFSLKVSD